MHRNSTPYRPKANGAVEAANKNLKKILPKMVQGSRQWHEKLPLALFGYRITVRTSIGATPYLLVYGTEVVVVKAEIDEDQWVKTRLEQLSLIDEKRLTSIRRQPYSGVQSNQKKIQVTQNEMKLGTILKNGNLLFAQDLLKNENLFYAQDSPEEWAVHGVLARAGPHGSIVSSVTLHFCKKLFLWLKPMTSGLYGSNFTSYAKASVGIYGFSIVHICFGGRTGRKIGQKLETQATSLTHLIRFCLDGVVKQPNWFYPSNSGTGRDGVLNLSIVSSVMLRKLQQYTDSELLDAYVNAFEKIRRVDNCHLFDVKLKWTILGDWLDCWRQLWFNQMQCDLLQGSFCLDFVDMISELLSHKLERGDRGGVRIPTWLRDLVSLYSLGKSSPHELAFEFVMPDWIDQLEGDHMVDFDESIWDPCDWKTSGMAVELVNSATSDKLTEIDWTKNIEICELVARDHKQARDVVKAIKKRLGSKSANSQLFSVNLLEMLINNIGEPVHKQVIDTGILPILVKIVKKKSDLPVREKIFLLLDAAQTSLGGASGRFPQYYSAYYELVVGKLTLTVNIIVSLSRNVDLSAP
ncbi:putative mediator of RNA polymerase II transcription subunit 26c-like [Capsicum annuum]|nr:putative mediator of RNA polymerase II transcription subunit 26c-like [Capsicum annuum]